MDNDLLANLLNGAVATNVGPHAKEILLEQAETEFNNGNFLQSIFFQVRTLLQAFQERFSQLETKAENSTENTEQLWQQMNEWEKENLKSNPLMQYVVAALKESAMKNKKSPATKEKSEHEYKPCNFLQNIQDPLVGVQKIEEICAQLPKEWTVLQLCKGPRTETTYSIFSQIHEQEANIYLTLLKHARSAEYPQPLCLRFCGNDQSELFKKFASIANRFKQSINVDPKMCNTKEAKKMYWDVLEELNQYIGSALADLKTFFFPWNFLFTGRPLFMQEETAVAATGLTRRAYLSKAFCCVDKLCNEYQWAANERVLLSLAALHVNLLTEAEVQAICKVLSSNESEQAAAIKLLHKLQFETPLRESEANEDTTMPHISTNYPCILVIDERLDHFFWEELNVQQEFCRFNSLQCLWRLFQLYKANIRNGYLNVNINDGGCLVNPDSNLPKMELRMKSFFQYWTPHWLMKFSEKPTQDELLKDFFKRTCYVYAGHGSGLQYINGKHIAKQQMNCVVFLFGCDSSRLHSLGLYSELVGPHLYYHAAMCPTLVGTLMAGLDSFMDGIATAILSRWIAPKSKHTLVWQEIERSSWVKQGLIKPKLSSGSAATKATIANTPNYHMGSLCAILARVHQRKIDTKYYNTVPYVCRGLPVWNCNVQELPQTTL